MRTFTVTALVLAGSLAFVACKASRPASTDATESAAAPAAANTNTAAPATQATSLEESGTFTGTVAETMTSGNYTYVRLKSDSKEVWAAAPQFDAKVGEPITVSLDMPMRDFTSKTLNRTFPLLYFVAEVGRHGQPLSTPGQASAPAMMSSHADNAAAAAPVEKIAPPSGGMSIADVFAKKGSLSGKTVIVRGKVVKFNGGILDRNWVHLQDGSGSADAHDNDLTVTTDGEVKVGDVVTASGVLGTNKDFGAGYAYDAILEKATVSR